MLTMAKMCLFSLNLKTAGNSLTGGNLNHRYGGLFSYLRSEFNLQDSCNTSRSIDILLE